MRGFRRNSVKEALDNLPDGVCFFNRKGIVTLCNHRMTKLVFALTGRDLQSIADIRSITEGDSAAACRQKDIFILEDKSAWRFSEERVITRYGAEYTQVTAAEVTELYRRQRELLEENRLLEEYGNRLRQLSADVIAVTREEEALNMKMRLHDDIGRCVIATRQLLQQGRPATEADIISWKNAVGMLKREKERQEKGDSLQRFIEAAAGIGLRITVEGALPANNEKAKRLIIAAMRECATNAVRHGEATEMYVRIERVGENIRAGITNNGKNPAENAAEGGGLTSLRTLTEKSGAALEVKFLPDFRLTLTVPAEKEKQL